jgi:7-cyano-7-deazaguanine synthase
MDSTVLLHQFKDEIALAISFRYGARHNDQELKFAEINCKKLGISHRIVELPLGSTGIKSALLGDEDIPDGNYSEINQKSTVVPFRNGIMLAIATAVAENENINKVLIANHFGDHAIYPDCTKKFISGFEEAAKFGTYNSVKIVSPYCEKSKTDIAQIGKHLNVDFARSYSCYNGKELHCGTCSTCLERKEALKGFDTTKYQ